MNALSSLRAVIKEESGPLALLDEVVRHTHVSSHENEYLRVL